MRKGQFGMVLSISLILSTPCNALQNYEKFWGLYTYTNRQLPWYLMVEPQIRLVNLPGVYEQFLLNAGVGHSILPELELWLGQTYTNVAANNALVEDMASSDMNEYRIWQQLLWNHQAPSHQFELRSRLEERYSIENSPWSLRWRNRCLWKIPFFKKYSIIISDEFFFNLNHTSWIVTETFDQNRALIGLSIPLNQHLNYTVGYMNQYLTRTPREDNHALMFNIFFQA